MGKSAIRQNTDRGGSRRGWKTRAPRHAGDEKPVNRKGRGQTGRRSAEGRAWRAPS